MYALGHVGIGVRLLPRKVRERCHFGWLALGCLLPDLIDKPLFLAVLMAGNHSSAHLQVLRHSRLLGHSIFFWVALALGAVLLRREWLRALAVAVPTHLFLDLVPDLLSGERPGWPRWLLWPLFRWSVPDGPRANHDLGTEGAMYLAGEVIGAALLIWGYVRSRRARRIG